MRHTCDKLSNAVAFYYLCRAARNLLPLHPLTGVHNSSFDQWIQHLNSVIFFETTCSTHARGIFRKIHREEFRQCPVLIISVSDWQFIAWHRHVELTLVRSLQFSASAASWQRRPATQKTNGPRILMKGCITAPKKKKIPLPIGRI